MKINKIIMAMAMSVLTLSLSAAITSKATLTVASAYGPTDDLDLFIDQDATYLGEDIPGNVNALSVNLYAVIESANYASVKKADLNNLKVVFAANSTESNYTMTFSNVLGSITLSAADTSFVIDATKPYAFTCAAGSTKEFTVNPTVEYNYTREIATGKWGTICYPEAISEVVGATIYEFIEKTATQVVADQVSMPLAKGKAYLFLATADAQGFNYSDATQATAPEANNGLVGTFVDITSTAEAPYVIKGNSLMPAKPAKVAANRAYVPVLGDIQNTGAPARAGRMYFNVVNTPTGMELIEAPAMKEGKMILNGRMVIVKDGKMFNAQGAAL